MFYRIVFQNFVTEYCVTKNMDQHLNSKPYLIDKLYRLDQPVSYGLILRKYRIDKLSIDRKYWHQQQEMTINRLIRTYDGLNRKCHFSR